MRRWRLIVSYQIPIHDIDAAVKEVRWAAAEGCKSLQLPVFPAELGLPDYWDRRYDELWTAIQDADLPICCHMLTGVLERFPRLKVVFVEPGIGWVSWWL